MELKPLLSKSKKTEKISVYFPWLRRRVQIPDEKTFWELRTVRNRDLITHQEQLRLKKKSVGVAGLSVGNSAALSLALEGFENFRLADFDLLSLTNLNRLRTGIQSLGQNKAVITARQIYELNPYAHIKLYTEGLDETLMKKFLGSQKKLDVLVEETDNLEIKLKIRILARKLRIPVISATDMGDNAILDIERFDLEPRRPIYHGLIKGSFDFSALKTMSFSHRLKLINKIVGEKYITNEMKQSLKKIGKTLETWPQLGGTAQLAGAVVTYAARKISLGERLPSGKYNLNLERMIS